MKLEYEGEAEREGGRYASVKMDVTDLLGKRGFVERGLGGAEDSVSITRTRFSVLLFRLNVFS